MTLKMLTLCSSQTSREVESLSLSFQILFNMGEVKPLIYAELLSNIRQVSVIAALNSPSDASTRVELLDGGSQVVVSHYGQSSALTLPGKVSPYSQLQKPAFGQKEVSWRLPLASAPSSARVVENLQENETPWSARNLKEDAEFSCRECNAIVIKKGLVKEWRDLPSENWAEMMEFWHCHKPDVPKHEQNGLNGDSSGHTHQSGTYSNANRGYGANTKFIARKSIGFVDPTTFLLASADCSNIQGLQVRRYFFPPIWLFSQSNSSYFGHQEGGHTCFCSSIV
jgi:hypothetical protein